MAPSEIIGEPSYKIEILDISNNFISFDEGYTSYLFVHLCAKFSRHPLSSSDPLFTMWLVENGMEDTVVCENALALSRGMVLNSNSYAAKVRIDRLLGDSHLHPSTFFVSDKIIDTCREHWDEEESHLYLRVDVSVFVSDLPQPDYSEFDTDINFVPASLDSIDQLEKIVNEDEEIVCRVCLDDVQAGLEATKLPCKHIYHEKCIVTWLLTSRNCPICRLEIV